MFSRKKIYISGIVVLVVLAALFAGRYFLLRSSKAPKTYLEEFKDIVKSPGADVSQPEEKAVTAEPAGSIKEEKTLPEKIFIKVPFTSQAPFAVWDIRHEEACEEASLLMLAYYFQGEKLNKEIAEKEVQELIKFQIEKYGDYKDSNVGEIVKLAEDFYGIKNLRVIYDFSKGEIKKELAKGNPIIVPAAGRLLGNPYYTQPGPLYHNLVLVGYSGDKIITNDPGTRKGEGYRYPIDVLYNAIHDFPGDKNKINEGRKAMIVIDGQS
ncbi:MAG: C39 family peptidase [Candidatus Moranbacteria bacterium]|nr:C39 family peptidase [Candidatus Moranbacteria bacterium]